MTKKRTKKYSGPKYVSNNPMSTFFGGLSGDHMPHLQRTLTVNHLALSSIVQGKGTRDDFDRLVGAINMANVLCEQGIGNEFREITIAARDALKQVGERSLVKGVFGFTGDELKAMNAAMECHDAQLENIRAIDIDRAADEVERRLRHRINTVRIVDTAMVQGSGVAA